MFKEIKEYRNSWKNFILKNIQVNEIRQSVKDMRGKFNKKQIY